MRAAACLASLAVAALLLAGCGAKAPAPATTRAPTAQPALHGYVFDDALHPLADAQVRLLDGNVSAKTDAAGHFQLMEVPRDVPMELVASLPQFKSAVKQVSVPAGAALQVNFTLTPVPAKVARVDVLKFKGFLACEATTATPNQTVDCSNGQQKDLWQFAADVDLEGVVVQVVWTAGSPLSDRLHARLVTTDLGKLNAVLADAAGPSPLRLEVPREAAMRYYGGAGGLLKLTVDLDPGSASGPAGAGVSAQQSFDAVASLFYNQATPAGYTVGSTA